LTISSGILGSGNLGGAFCYARVFRGVVIESMAMGKPVIATGIGATPELIEDGSRNTSLAGNARELAGRRGTTAQRQGLASFACSVRPSRYLHV